MYVFEFLDATFYNVYNEEPNQSLQFQNDISSGVIIE